MSLPTHWQQEMAARREEIMLLWRQGVSQAEIGRRMKLSDSRVSQIVNGWKAPKRSRTRPPEAASIQRLAERLDAIEAAMAVLDRRIDRIEALVQRQPRQQAPTVLRKLCVTCRDAPAAVGLNECGACNHQRQRRQQTGVAA